MKPLLMIAALALIGCKKEEKPAPTPSPTTTPTPATSPTPSGDGKTAVIDKVNIPEPAEAVAPAEPAKPKKLSEIDGFDLMDGIKAAGWEAGAAGSMSQGAWASTNIDATRGDVKARVTLLKPTGQPEDKKSSMKLQTPKEVAPAVEKRGGAVLLRDDAMLAVEIEGKPDEAKALLAALADKLPLID